jgi:hypothetical protein
VGSITFLTVRSRKNYVLCDDRKVNIFSCRLVGINKRVKLKIQSTADSKHCKDKIP